MISILYPSSESFLTSPRLKLYILQLVLERIAIVFSRDSNMPSAPLPDELVIESRYSGEGK